MIGKFLLLLASLFSVAFSQTSSAACSQNPDCRSCNLKVTGCKWFVPNENSEFPLPICRPKRNCKRDERDGKGACFRKRKHCPAPPTVCEKSSWPELVGTDKDYAKGIIEGDCPQVTVRTVEKDSPIILNVDLFRVWLFYDPQDNTVARIPSLG